MQPSFYPAEIIQNDLIGEHVRHLKLSPSEKLSYTAGQFFILRLRDEKGELIERSYSAASFDDSGEIEFVVRIEPHGRMSGLIDLLEVGTSIDIKGPFGRFGLGDLHGKDVEKLVLIGGGVGISPLRSMITQLKHQGDSTPTQLFYGFRTPADYLFREEFEGYAASETFSLFPAISQGEDEEWHGDRGYVGDILEGKIFAPEEGVHCFICGPPPMVKATREKLFELGFERSQVHVEAW